ncbi:hypothetical protein [Pseudomonas capsici]|uniref:hypothetical protein n=1 Tax=Pseudomonas capsici TaxID=2810614 RepID=UPI0021F13497|nr:hypothetical protein [Pseudomonas capsici]
MPIDLNKRLNHIGRVDQAYIRQAIMQLGVGLKFRYLAQFLPAHEYDRTRVKLSAGDLLIGASGKQIVAMGWKALFRPQAQRK